MNICGHLIKTTDIIGIGPLCYQESPDLTLRTLYEQQRLVFDIYTSRSTIEIKSDYFNVGTGQSRKDDKIMQEHYKRYVEFENDYYSVKRTIAILIEESMEEIAKIDKKENQSIDDKA